MMKAFEGKDGLLLTLYVWCQDIGLASGPYKFVLKEDVSAILSMLGQNVYMEFSRGSLWSATLLQGRGVGTDCRVLW